MYTTTACYSDSFTFFYLQYSRVTKKETNILPAEHSVRQFDDFHLYLQFSSITKKEKNIIAR
jgi:hypothetical protein